MGSFPLPYDLLQHFIIPRYFLGSIRSERDLDSARFPVMLMVLQLVNKQFNTSVRKCTLAWKIIQNFRNCPSILFNQSIGSMLEEGCREFGSSSLLEWLSSYLHYPLLPLSCYIGAAKGGHVKLLDWLDSQTEPITSLITTPLMQIFISNFQVYEWFAKKKSSFYKKYRLPLIALRCAIKYGNRKMLEELFKIPSSRTSDLMICNAVLCGESTLEVLKLAVSHGAKVSLFDVSNAGQTSAEVLEWLRIVYGCTFSYSFFYNAIKAGKIDVLDYLYKNYSHLCDSNSLLANAVCLNRIEVVKWCLSKGMVLDKAFCNYLFETSPSCYFHLFSAEMVGLLSVNPEKLLEEVRDTERDRKMYGFLAFHHIRPVDISSAIYSSSYCALEVTRYLLEQLNCSLPPENEFRVDEIRKDVLAYLKQQGLLK